MKNTYCNFLFIVFVSFLFSACSKTKARVEETSAKIAHQDLLNEVKVQKLQYSVFNKELVSNGKLYAVNKCELNFEGSGVLEEMPIVNGKWVAKGDLLGKLNDFEARNVFENSRQALVKAKLDFEDLLIGQGYKLTDTIHMAKDLLVIVKIKSGYSRALSDFNKAEHDMQSTKVWAPFSGVIANVNGHLHAKVKHDKSYCLLIDNSIFNVEFSVMESELSDLKRGQKVELTSLANGTSTYGQITQINPLIESNGLVKVIALVKNKRGQFIEGMNVNVSIKKQIENKLVVPKSAVLLRQNKEVVFVHENGKAIWHYVKTADENSDSFVISEGIEEGDQVIISGNLNLAHESEVKVVK